MQLLHCDICMHVYIHTYTHIHLTYTYILYILLAKHVFQKKKSRPSILWDKLEDPIYKKMCTQNELAGYKHTARGCRGLGSPRTYRFLHHFTFSLVRTTSFTIKKKKGRSILNKYLRLAFNKTFTVEYPGWLRNPSDKWSVNLTASSRT